MELSQLAYFRAVARTEHFTRAAEELHITQPSLSKAIANLEGKLGCTRTKEIVDIIRELNVAHLF